MAVGGVIVLVLVGLVWVAFVWMLLRGTESNQDSEENQPEAENQDSSL